MERETIRKIREAVRVGKIPNLEKEALSAGVSAIVSKSDSVEALVELSPNHPWTRNRVADTLPFFRRTSLVYLPFVKLGVNRGLCSLNGIWEFRIVGFEDGSFVQFFPNIGGFHNRFSLWHRGTARPCQ